VVFPLEFFCIVGDAHVMEFVAAPCVVAKNAKSFWGGFRGFGPNGQFEGHFFPSKRIWGRSIAFWKRGVLGCLGAADWGLCGGKLYRKEH
jgi:hypothetical protein